MDASERRTLIEERVTRNGEVQFAQLARELSVSEMTIRRDIEALESTGIVRRISGGAIAVHGSGTAFEPSYGARAGRAVDTKMHIATAIADALSPGETVILDSGSTLAAVAHAICGRGLGLTVITPSLTVATILAEEPDTTIVVTGGTLRPGELSLIGSEAERLIGTYNCDTFIAGVAGVDAARGLTEYHPQEAAVKRASVAAARRVIVGVDSAKLGRVHLVSIAPLSAVELLVTDAPGDDPCVSAAREAGVETLLVRPLAP
ncbi:DeoR/GlpR family DNA-binding transcription regulator [Microbacterium indicum]|uniref:DeoR/GlpR family DNA-binding transcription regulator n=1 Tax=Microbacterium indicum TaxID=358100 RepID=UPI000415B1E8|nr:DeoR/GlpR family DNA-binding transcription regulator [Microbacterium indicum]